MTTALIASIAVFLAALVVGFAVSAVLWIGLPAVLSRLVEHDGTAASPGC